MATYGVLLISGRMTHQEGHAAAFAQHPQCRLVAVADEADVPPTRHRLNRELAQQYGIPYIPHLEEALALPDVDIVSMCADVERRGRVATRCARAGKHLYLDKPLAGSVADAEAIARAVEEAGVVAQMYSFVHAPRAQAARRLLEEGGIGQLRALHAEVVFAKGRPGTVPPGAVRKEKARPHRFTFVEAKRELFDIGVYAVGLVQWLAGRPVRSVLGLTGNYFFAEHARLDVEDLGALALRMEDGLTATVLGGRFGWTSHPKGGLQSLTLIGDRGVATFDAWRPRLEVYNDEPDFTMPRHHPMDPMGMWRSTQQEAGVQPKRRWQPLFDEAQVMAEDVAQFVRCIEEGRRPVMDPRTAAPLVETIMAGYASAAWGRWVDLPLPQELRGERQP